MLLAFLLSDAVITLHPLQMSCSLADCPPPHPNKQHYVIYFHIPADNRRSINRRPFNSAGAHQTKSPADSEPNCTSRTWTFVSQSKFRDAARKPTGRRAMTNASSVIDVVRLERRTCHFLKHVDVFIGGASTQTQQPYRQTHRTVRPS